VLTYEGISKLTHVQLFPLLAHRARCVYQLPAPSDGPLQLLGCFGGKDAMAPSTWQGGACSARAPWPQLNWIPPPNSAEQLGRQPRQAGWKYAQAGGPLPDHSLTRPTNLGKMWKRTNPAEGRTDGDCGGGRMCRHTPVPGAWKRKKSLPRSSWRADTTGQAVVLKTLSTPAAPVVKPAWNVRRGGLVRPGVRHAALVQGCSQNGRQVSRTGLPVAEVVVQVPSRRCAAPVHATHSCEGVQGGLVGLEACAASAAWQTA
jgi:hypothetical protein